VALAPRLPTGHAALGALHLDSGRYEDARRELRTAIDLDPGLPEAWTSLGNAQRGLGDLEAAKSSYQRALTLRPDNTDALVNLANLLRERGQEEEAEVVYRRALASNPASAMAHHNLGVLLWHVQRADEAQASFAAALRLDPGSVDTRFNLGCLLAAQMRLPEAVAELAHVAEMAPDHTPAGLRLAEALVASGDPVRAERVYERLLEHRPDAFDAWLGLAATRLVRGAAEESAAAFERALAIRPDDVPALAALAECLRTCGRDAEADRTVERAARLDAPRTYLLLAGGAVLRGDYEAAHGLYRRVLALDPSDEDAARMLARIDLTQGRYDVATWKAFALFSGSVRSAAPAADMLDAQALESPPEPAGRTICVQCEQGIGDELFFLRFATRLRELGARVAYVASQKVGALLRARGDLLDAVLLPAEPPPPSDYGVWLTDVPRLLGALEARGHRAAAPAESDRTRIGPLAPFPLSPLQARLEGMRERLRALGPPPYLGATWRAGPEQLTLTDAQRGLVPLSKRVAPERLGEALRDTDATVIVLQRHPRRDEIEAFVAGLGRTAHDLSDANENLEDMLALLALLDEHVGVSNTNMHLAAGLGRPARVLVPCPPEWRWMAEGDTSPWFPGFRVYRQTGSSDWAPALRRLAADLAGPPGVPSHAGRDPAAILGAAAATPRAASIAVDPATVTLSDRAPAVEAAQGPAAPALISDEYRGMQEALHRNPAYGVASVEFAPTVAEFMRAHGLAEVLDYGAGKGRLGQELAKLLSPPPSVRHYDPAIAAWSARAEPCGFVACIDVLEHIEPDLLPNVLDDLARVTRRFGLFTIATGPAGKILPDGRNAHLIQQGADWWLPRLMQRFELANFARFPRGFLVVVEAKR